MKILVLSDSHRGKSFMRLCMERIAPDAVIHLGDYYDDGQELQELYPQLPFYQVPGNCDANRGWIPDPEVRVERIGGVWMFLTHGHRHQVKLGLYGLVQAARAAKVQIALYGHTHGADCHREDDGLWVLNPGTCGTYGGSVGLLEVEQGKILSCQILREADL